MTLDKLNTFDLEVGMAVYGEDGQAIGNVTEVAGFGSTRLDPASDANAARVTQAQTGTGFFKVGRADMGDLCVPFNGIKEIVQGQSVTLTAAGLAEAQRRAEVPDRRSTLEEHPPQREIKRRGWAFWRSGSGT